MNHEFEVVLRSLLGYARYKKLKAIADCGGNLDSFTNGYITAMEQMEEEIELQIKELIG